MAGLLISEVGQRISELFTVYLFGTSELGSVLTIIFTLGILGYACMRFNLSSEATLLLLAAAFMLLVVGLYGWVGIVVAILLTIPIVYAVLRIWNR
jgi:uncharacterized membrane protein YedE/YeeE